MMEGSRPQDFDRKVGPGNLSGPAGKQQVAARRILAVGGGKGGVGKSVVSILLAAAYAGQGRRVILADLDLGAANLHTYLGIHQESQGIADFFLKNVSSLEPLLLDTPVPGVRLISGARYYPGMANPTYQAKLKLIRHIRELPADVILLDLGAGVHFNTLDFFSASRPGIIVLAPEPGSVLNAYSFVKGSVYRHLSSVFSRQPEIREILEDGRTEWGNESSFSLEAFRELVRRVDPVLEPLVAEVIDAFKPALIMNQAGGPVSEIYADNLRKLVHRRLALDVEHLGSLPLAEGLSRYLSGMAAFLRGRAAAPLMQAATEITRMIEMRYPQAETAPAPDLAGPARMTRTVFGDEEIETLEILLDGLEDRFFKSTKRSILRLRLFYRPAEVVQYLVDAGVVHPVLFEPA